MSLEKVLLDLKKSKVAPCYLLYGEEEYLIQEALGDILDLLVPPSDRDFGLFWVDGNDADFDLLRDRLSTPSLLGGRKVVVIKNTEIFQSRENLGGLIQKIRENLGENQDKAVRSFQAFLRLSGFTWEDLQGAGWQKISDEQWGRAVEGDPGDDRHTWLPRIVEICAGRDMASGGDADLPDPLEKLLADGLPAGNCLMLTADAVDKRKKIFKVIQKTGVVLHFGKIKEAATRETLKGEARKLLDGCGKSLTSAAWAALGKKTGFRLRPSLNELQKLVVFAGEKAVIGEEDVETVVGKTKEDSIFELTNALSEKKAKAALLALQALLDQGEPPLMILAMISREIRLLLQASILVQSGKLPPVTPGMEFPSFQKNVYPSVSAMAQGMARKEDFLVGKHPFVIFNALRHCRRFSYSVLVGYLDELLEMDLAMKSTTTDPRLLLERFLIKVCA
ncbi:MAG: DNA polymerase III subunit delta [Smithella sp.]|jgi:DNA polymerase-3 subunit delta|nr:DNA polymerase III subunit delta [Smithellaceae bacterium]NLA41377.1 DNA polymerase III subunit delta [Smithella sp.]